MINGDNRGRVSNIKNHKVSHEEVGSKQLSRSGRNKIAIVANTDNNKVSVMQKVLNFIENYLHIKIFNRKVKAHNASNYVATTESPRKNHFEFNLTNNIDTIETPIDYIQTNNKLTIYDNLDSILRYFSDFIDNYSTIGAINHDTVIEFLKNKTNKIKSDIVLLDKKGNSNSIIPPDVDYLKSLNKVGLKTVIMQVNQELKKIMNATFESRGYNPDTERDRLAKSLKSPELLQDIQNQDSFLLHTLETQMLTIGIPDGNIKVTYDVITSKAQLSNIYREEDISYEFVNNDIDTNADDTNELLEEDIQQELSKLTSELQNAQLKDSATLRQLSDQQNHDDDDTLSNIQHLLSSKTSYYQLTYEIDLDT
jgi:hypothetical protein